MKFRRSIIILLFCYTAIGCKNHYNDTIAWIDDLEGGLTIEQVKELQPEYIEIDWKNPVEIFDEKWYLVKEIKGNNDPLAMSHFLSFTQDGYAGRESKK